jgi:hypothetical protein
LVLVIVIIKMGLMLSEYLFFLPLPLLLLVLASLFLEHFLFINWLLVVIVLGALLCNIIGATKLVIIAQKIEVLGGRYHNIIVY